ncbi:hypothetical protein C7C56_018940 [Massilia glaciei]|uniref:Uncharacterized protein n=2 Tax=Massilia glaciei TaxID=1524097 RepID=A0A2U2HH33_9BURK|nr:hypothetical protein C7C56_018940 [Massilia glaciei]
MFDAQVAFFTDSVHALVDAGVNAAELQAEAVKTLMATATVATRQWFMTSKTNDWLTPVAHLVNDGQLELAALPGNARAPAPPENKTAAGTSR